MTSYFWGDVPYQTREQRAYAIAENWFFENGRTREYVAEVLENVDIDAVYLRVQDEWDTPISLTEFARAVERLQEEIPYLTHENGLVYNHRALSSMSKNRLKILYQQAAFSGRADTEQMLQVIRSFEEIA